MLHGHGFSGALLRVYHRHWFGNAGVVCQSRRPVLVSVKVPQAGSVKGALGVAVSEKQLTSGQAAVGAAAVTW